MNEELMVCKFFLQGTDQFATDDSPSEIHHQTAWSIFVGKPAFPFDIGSHPRNRVRVLVTLTSRIERELAHGVTVFNSDQSGFYGKFRPITVLCGKILNYHRLPQEFLSNHKLLWEILTNHSPLLEVGNMKEYKGAMKEIWRNMKMLLPIQHKIFDLGNFWKKCAESERQCFFQFSTKYSEFRNSCWIGSQQCFFRFSTKYSESRNSCWIGSQPSSDSAQI